ncbi:MAG: amidohydrolase family protein [Woeseiaceae bacterium]|nr:amidohydrolase family protein [Woeseiaceae bacterium]
MSLPRRFVLPVLVLALGGCAPEEAPRGTAITNVTVIDAVDGARSAQTVVFDGDEILAVQPASEPVNAARTIDGSDRFLIPGLWDMHVHLTYDDAFTEDMSALFLAHGITSVRDTGGLLHKLEPVVQAMRAPDAIAPRVYFSGPLLDGRLVVYDGVSRPEIGVGNPTPEMARQSVETLVRAGVDFIKIYELVSPDVFTALAGAAEADGLPIAAHVPLSMIASRAGPQVDSMEHLRNVELDCAANAAELHEERLAIIAAYDGGSGYELRSRLHALQRLPAIAAYDAERCARVIDALTSTIQVPTLRLNTLSLHPTQARRDWDEIVAKLPEGARSEWQASFEDHREQVADGPPDTTFAAWSLELTGRLHAAGVPIGAGTDTPIGWALPGFSLHTELERLVEAGLSPLEAIESATIRPAEFFSLTSSMGRIAAGMTADLVLLDANPLEDIRNTRRVHRVVAAGRVLNPAELLSD